MPVAKGGNLVARIQPQTSDGSEGVDAPWIVRRFLRRHRPKFGMILEIELWPGLMAGAKSYKIPMIMAQAQYPIRSFLRDKPWPALRRHLVQGFALIMAKSTTHAARFQDSGAPNVAVMGELRFDFPIPPAHLAAAKALRVRLAGRPHHQQQPLLTWMRKSYFLVTSLHWVFTRRWIHWILLRVS